MSAALHLEGISLRRGNEHIIDEATVRFAAGSTTIIVGASGSGKTALLKVAAGLLPPDRGTVRLGENDLYSASDARRLELRAGIGFLFQDAALWANRTVLDNISLPLLVHRRALSTTEIADLAHTRLTRFGLDRLASLRPHELAAGEQKAVAMVRALVLDPALVLLDEPLGAVDHRLGARIQEEIRGLRARGCTIIAVTNDEDLTANMADHLVVMQTGQVLAHGAFDEVKASGDPRVREILEHVLGEIVAYDTDLLQILSRDGNSNE
jgi:phospholipid/cholesterol/gamma-HCH transport system ATP-binding protein